MRAGCNMNAFELISDDWPVQQQFFEDQLASVKKCSPHGQQVLVPTETIRDAARLA